MNHTAFSVTLIYSSTNTYKKGLLYNIMPTTSTTDITCYNQKNKVTTNINVTTNRKVTTNRMPKKTTVTTSLSSCPHCLNSHDFCWKWDFLLR